MSVIVRKLASPTMEVFVKGAPEVMKDICTPESSKGSFFLFIALCIFITLLTYIFFFYKCPRIIKKDYTNTPIADIGLLHALLDNSQE